MSPVDYKINADLKMKMVIGFVLMENLQPTIPVNLQNMVFG
jgi:hypothetical protein